MPFDRILWPPLRAGEPDGATDQFSLLLYGYRDFRGVETPAANPPDRTGFNEEAEWTARAESAFRREHADNGRHSGAKFPLAWFGIEELVDEYGQMTVALHPGCRITPGPTHEEEPIGKLVIKDPGSYVIELFSSLPAVVFTPECGRPLEVRQISGTEIGVEVYRYDAQGNRMHEDCAFTAYPE